jgi:aminoglycoside phosphotransferase (APT) family kinase protein
MAGLAPAEKPMPIAIDHEMEEVARRLWPSPQSVRPVSGGLFNRVVRVDSAAGIGYLKRFTASASSGDFPPLPTTAAERCLVASSWHELASRSSVSHPSVAVPPLVAVETRLDLVAMEHAHGEPLYDALIGDGAGIGEALQAVAAWLAVLHRQQLEPRARLLAASNPFKRFKVDLQYTRLLPELPQELRRAARQFVRSYLSDETDPVHGDLNSRNVLHAPGVVSVIDFEQGHYGDGAYDLAYLLSEYVIRSLRLALSPEPALSDAWARYAQGRRLAGDGAAWRRFRVHTAFQTLYRLVGPSRQVWTGHLSAEGAAEVRRWSIAELATWLR